MILPSWFNFIQYIEVRLKYEPHVGYKCTTFDACGLGTFRLVSTLFLCCINLAGTSGSFLFINLRGKGIQSHDANTIFTYGYIAYKCNCIVSVCLLKLFLVKHSLIIYARFTAMILPCWFSISNDYMVFFCKIVNYLHQCVRDHVLFIM